MKTKMFGAAVVGGWTAALVVGCAHLPSVGPDYEESKLKAPEFALPDAGQVTTNLTSTGEYAPATGADDRRITVSKEVIEKWWERFGDPILRGLVEGGVTNNIGFLMAQRRLAQRSYELLGSYAAFLPHFGVNGAWQRNWKNSIVPGGNGENGYAYNAQNVGLDGNWEIDICGGSRRATEAAFAQAEAAGWTVSDAWVSLTTQIGIEYVNLRTTQELIDVARTNLVLQSETYDILKSRLDSGIGDELAVNQCAYIVEETRAKIPTLMAQEERQKNRLAILAGEMPGALHERLKPLADQRDWLLAPQKVSELKLDMMRARPDVMAAERELAAATARLGVAKSQWYPKFYLSGLVGWQSTGNPRLFRADSFVADLGPSFSWPIFQGGAIYANVKATEARLEELALAYEETILTAYGEVRDSYSAYTQEYHRYSSLKGAVKAATDAVTISQDLYKNGLRDFNNVLDAQRSRLAYEEQYALSRGQITVHLIELYKSLGGGLAYEKGTDAKD